MSAHVTDPECLFCRIVAGEIPSHQVYADDTAVAFLDVAPFKTGHTLVVPRTTSPMCWRGRRRWLRSRRRSRRPGACSWTGWGRAG